MLWNTLYIYNIIQLYTVSSINRNLKAPVLLLASNPVRGQLANVLLEEFLSLPWVKAFRCPIYAKPKPRPKRPSLQLAASIA